MFWQVEPEGQSCLAEEKAQDQSCHLCEAVRLREAWSRQVIERGEGGDLLGSKSQGQATDLHDGADRTGGPLG